MDDKIINNQEDIVLNIDIGDRNISIRNSNFVITKNHSNDNIIYKSKDIDSEYFEDDTCCISCKLGFRKSLN